MLAKEIADYLAANGLGTVGTNVFALQLPSAPDTCLAVYPTGGGRADSKLGYDNPTIQVRTRSSNPLTAFENAAQAYNLLHGLRRVTLSGGSYLVHCTGIQSAPVYIGRDERKRDEYTLNYQLVVRNQSTHRE